MVAKLTTGKNIRGIINYNENKVKEGTASLIMAHNFGHKADCLNFNDKINRFEKLIIGNKRVKTNALHISLNFDPSEKIDQEKLKLIATLYMEKIGFKNQPYLVYEHFDAAHPHIHIVTTNIQHSGDRIDLHNIGRNQSETARKEIERVFDLVQAETRGKLHKERLFPIPLEKAVYGQAETKRTISNIIREVTRTYKYTSLPELNAVLRFYNILAEPIKFNKNNKLGLVYNIINEKGKKLGVPIKSSSIYGKPTMTFLEKQFGLNKILRKPDKHKLIYKIDHALNPKNNLSIDSFIHSLNKEGVSVLFRENDNGKVYGVTFVDHKTKTVFNGSDLGKQYSANGLIEKLKVPAINSSDKKYDELLLKSIEKQIFQRIDHPLTIEKADPSTSISIDMVNQLSNLLEAKEVKFEFVPPGFSRRKKRKRKQKL